MAIEFRKVVRQARYLDPAANFAEVVRTGVVRKDPLLGHESGIPQGPGWAPPKQDLSALIELSLKQGCPFCPEVVEKVMTKFIKEFVPEGRIRVGECIVAPMPGAATTYAAVARLSDKHFIGMGDFSEEILVNSFLAVQTYFRQVLSYDPNARYQAFTWNYMPGAGASLVHAHFQIQVDTEPSKQQGDILKASKHYSDHHRSNFWADLVAQEQASGERYIGTMGNVAWLTPFAPAAQWDSVIAVFKGADAIVNIPEADLRDFASGLRRVLSYFSDRNFDSFNLCLYSGLVGQSYFWVNARIEARAPFIPVMGASEFANMEKFHNVYRVAAAPEQVCSKLKSYFD